MESCPYCRTAISSSKSNESELYFTKIKVNVPNLDELIKFFKYSIINTNNFDDLLWLMNEIQLKQPDFDNLFENGDSLLKIAITNSNMFLVEYLFKMDKYLIDQLSEKEQNDLVCSAIEVGHFYLVRCMFEQCT